MCAVRKFIILHSSFIIPMSLPRHIAVIMDGNGRWATARGLSRRIGHIQGYEALRRVVTLCGDRGIEYLTAYSFSSENWRRPKDEVDALMALIESAAREQLPNLLRDGVRFNVIGRLNQLPDTLQAQLQENMDATRDATGLTLTLAINYGSRSEIVDAVRSLVASGISPEDVDDAAIANHLYTAGLPDPDLLIRTAGELRVSNYLLWQIAYTEIHVTNTLWPEFDEPDLVEALEAYENRTRKFGAVG
jgi:undecaprenyl diphosphate synthase